MITLLLAAPLLVLLLVIAVDTSLAWSVYVEEWRYDSSCIRGDPPDARTEFPAGVCLDSSFESNGVWFYTSVRYDLSISSDDLAEANVHFQYFSAAGREECVGDVAPRTCDPACLARGLAAHLPSHTCSFIYVMKKYNAEAKQQSCNVCITENAGGRYMCNLQEGLRVESPINTTVAGTASYLEYAAQPNCTGVHSDDHFVPFDGAVV